MMNLLPFVFGSIAMAPVQAERVAKAIEISSFSTWSVQLGPNNAMVAETVSPPLDPGMNWDELVVSWNAELADAQHMEVQVRTIDDGSASRFFSLGTWSNDSQNFDAPAGRRSSVMDQKDARGEVQTDTLVLNRPGRKIEVRLFVTASLDGAKMGPHQPKSLTLSFRNSKAAITQREPNKASWGAEIDVPIRSQMSYPNGNVICSPTSTSMLLAYWSKKLGKPEVDRDVPEVVSGVYDPAWKGTGNWIFNTAFASRVGLVGSVLRLTDLRDVEDLVGAGIPVATSVSYALLKGRDKKEANDGHIVVLRGFTKSGDPMFNDPGRSTEVRQTYGREAFKRAWAVSGNTIYLIQPPGLKRPKLSVD